MIAVERCRADLDLLGLPHAASVLESRLDTAAKKELSYADFLADLLRIEVKARDDDGRARRLKQARLPFVRRLDQFDFAFQPSVDKRLVKELGNLSFTADGQNVILLWYAPQKLDNSE